MKQQKTKKKSYLLRSLIVIGLMMIGFSGYVITNADPLQNYQNVIVTTNDISTYYTFSGSITSKNTQMVTAKRMMTIESVKIKPGTVVKKDQVLFETTDGTKIKSKINGTIEKVMVKVDDQVLTGAGLCEIYDLVNLEAQIKIDEYDVIAVQVGDETTLTVSALKLQQSQPITELSSVAISANGIAFYQAKVALSPQETIKIGMSVEVKMLKDQATQVLSIPMKAIMFDEANKPYVYTLINKRQLQKTSLVLGINDGKLVEVVDGLNAGQVVYYRSALTNNENGGFMPPVPGR